MTTYTNIARLPIMTPFDPSIRNAWGPPINSAWQAIEQLAAGNGQIDLTGLTAYSVTVANDATDQARQGMLAFTGSTPGTCTVTIPPVSRIGWVTNATTNTIVLTTGTGGTLSVPAGAAFLYTVNGTAVSAVPVTFSGTSANATVGRLSVSGGLSLDGRLFANADANTSLNTIYATAAVVGRGGVIFSGLRIATSAGAPIVSFSDSTTGTVAFSGPVSATAYITTSDARAKSDIEDITTADAYDWVRSGRARTYTIDGQQRAGFIAQEDIRNGRGAAVRRVDDDDPRYALGDGFAHGGQRLARDYEHDIAYLTRALAAALNRIDALEAAGGV